MSEPWISKSAAFVRVDADALETLATELRSITGEVRTSVVDLTQRDEIHALADEVNAQWRGLDLLINNAGVAFYGPTHQMTEAQWDRLMGINLEAPIHLTRRLMPALMSREGSHIANMCSVSGLVAGGRFNAYHTTKYGLVGFTEALRAEYGRSGLGVTAILLPSIVSVPFVIIEGYQPASGAMGRKMPLERWPMFQLLMPMPGSVGM